MNSLLFGIYVIGAILVAFWVMSVSAHETTSHGQGIIFTYGCLGILLWPLALLYALAFGAFLLVRGGIRIIGRWLR